ncbi:nacrein-like protein [Crassostrea angulata]|uniref:nacrein-like protein n=1 Tax=Magallana angulata TaxID=2784310 RepID=UPI0022B0E1B9|nr:nacrein-like protein [Crassostrea angulata]
MKMAALYWLVFLGSLCIGTVESAGYLYRMPHHGDVCYYEDLKNAHFSYDEETCRRPQEWCYLHKCWTTCGSTRRQSPINLDTSEARRTKASFQLYNKDKRVPAFTYNNGHAPHFSVKLNETKRNITLKLKSVSGRNPNEDYILADLHIHLGKEKDVGSEHSIDGKFYPMEAHMVFYNSKYGDISQAKPKDDGLVVIGVMIKAKRGHDDDDDDDNNDNDDDEEEDDGYEKGDDKERSEWESAWGHKYTYTRVCCHRNYGAYKHNGDGEDYFSKKCYKGNRKCKVRFARTLSHIMEKYYEKIKEYHHNEEEPKETKDPENLQCGEKPSDKTIQSECTRGGGHPEETYDVHCGISPVDVLPLDQRFYTYPGSLTTPPCYESVQWIVYKCPIKVSRKAFKALQHVEDAEKKPLNHHGVKRPIKINEFFNVSKNF